MPSRIPKSHNVPLHHIGAAPRQIGNHSWYVRRHENALERTDTYEMPREIGARMYYNGTSAQAFPQNAWTPIEFNALAEDTAAMTDIGGFPTRITITVNGFYAFGCGVAFTRAGYGAERIMLAINLYQADTTFKQTIGYNELHALANTNCNVTFSSSVVYCVAGDYAVALANHVGTAGNEPLSGSNAANQGVYFWAHKIH